MENLLIFIKILIVNFDMNKFEIYDRMDDDMGWTNESLIIKIIYLFSVGMANLI